MQNSAQVVVIGGGVVGCSVLYHLTKLGWSDVMLVERSDLTSGSTWHAAGGFHTLNGDTNMAALQGYTIQLYKELEALTGMNCGLHHVGGITLADNQARFEMLTAERAKHRYMGLHTELLTPAEITRMTDGLVNVDGIIGGLYDPLDGHLDPSGTTHAYAKAARLGGATIIQQAPGHAATSACCKPTPVPMAHGMSSPNRAQSMPNMWSMPAGYGRAKLLQWRAFICRFCQWRTSIW